MAQKVQVLLVDDLDGGEASETVTFALDGSNYEIDLSGKNASELRDAFAKYVGAARKAGRTATSSGRSARRSGGSSTATRLPGPRPQPEVNNAAVRDAHSPSADAVSAVCESVASS